MICDCTGASSKQEIPFSITFDGSESYIADCAVPAWHQDGHQQTAGKVCELCDRPSASSHLLKLDGSVDLCLCCCLFLNALPSGSAITVSIKRYLLGNVV